VSKWGLSYKAIEPLMPEEWNAVVDALNELNNRCPLEIHGGLAVFSGDGSTIVFRITHGLTGTPTTVSVVKAVGDLPDIDHVEVDATYIDVYFKSPPPSGTDNVKLFYIAMRF